MGSENDVSYVSIIVWIFVSSSKIFVERRQKQNSCPLKSHDFNDITP